MRQILDEVRTPYVLYVEHDTPLIGEIDFGAILLEMQVNELGVMRFYHEASIHPEHAHLVGERHNRWLETIQWSQRPHLAETAWYRNVMATCFGAEARTFIEDVLHGIIQHGSSYPQGIRAPEGREAWQRWRIAIWAPEGDIKRSTHLDARGDDPKYPLLVSYPGERPEGAPPEGWIG
jgi:hypothetical protein